jgi:type IV pilus assembly protein PilC
MTTTFTYKVKDRRGNVRNGKTEGASADLVAKSLRDKGLVPLEVQEKPGGLLQAEISMPGRNRVRQRDVVIFTRQFATMVNSGLSLIKALSVLVEQTDSKALAAVLAEVKVDVEQGTSLSGALERHPKVFSPIYVSMVRAGEVGGVLDETLNRLADMQEANLNLRSKVKSAMAYPAVVGFLIVSVTLGMIMFVVPIFERMYEDMAPDPENPVPLPVPTRLLVAFSDVLTSWWFVIVALIVAGVIGFRRWKKTEAGRYAWDAIKLRIPIFGKLFHKTSLSRFSRTFAVLSRTGVPVLQTLDITADTANNAKIERAIADVKASVREGESLAAPLARHDVFPPMVVQMMAVGEETGALDSMLSKVADFYEREVDDMVNSMTSLIEPLLIVFMGVSVGAILISLYLPIFGIGELVGG